MYIKEKGGFIFVFVFCIQDCLLLTSLRSACSFNEDDGRARATEIYKIMNVAYLEGGAPLSKTNRIRCSYDFCLNF